VVEIVFCRHIDEDIIPFEERSKPAFAFGNRFSLKGADRGIAFFFILDNRYSAVEVDGKGVFASGQGDKLFAEPDIRAITFLPKY